MFLMFLMILMILMFLMFLMQMHLLLPNHGCHVGGEGGGEGGGGEEEQEQGVVHGVHWLEGGEGLSYSAWREVLKEEPLLVERLL